MTNDRLQTLQPIKLDQKVIGAIFVSSDLSEIRAREKSRVRYGVVVMLCVVGIATLLGLWSQRYFIRPIIVLANLAKRIGQERDFSLRASTTYRDCRIFS